MADAISEHPVFILLTKDASDRCKVEEMFWNHFRDKYGDIPLVKISAGENSPLHTRIELGEIGASVVLMDVGPMPDASVGMWNAQSALE